MKVFTRRSKQKFISFVIALILVFTALPINVLASSITGSETQLMDPGEDSQLVETDSPDEGITDVEPEQPDSEPPLENIPEEGDISEVDTNEPELIIPKAYVTFVGFEDIPEDFIFLPIKIALLANENVIETGEILLNQSELIFVEQPVNDVDNIPIVYTYRLVENPNLDTGVNVEVVGDRITVEYIKPAIESNPDNLAGPEIIEGGGLIYLGGALRATDSPLKTFSMAALRSPTVPGDVELIKTVKEIPGLLNTFEVTLRIEALDAQTSNDIVLVIDTSGSMEGSRLDNTKTAAIQFVNQLLTETHPETRITLVSFASGATQRTAFLNYNGKQTLINSINSLNAVGGTHTQAGMHMAQTLLDGSSADIEQIVLLSDGQPTYSYGMNNPDDYLISYPGYGGQTGTGSPESNYNYGLTIGDGTDLRWRYYNDWFTNSNDLYYNHGNSAIAEAGFAKADGYTVHTIAMGAGTEGTHILNAMASPNKAYTTTDPTALAAIFDTIASDILAAMRNASVNDPMGTGFNVTDGYVTGLAPSQGEATYDATTRKISWDIGNLTTPTPETDDDPNLKYAELVYQVEINDDILGVVSADGTYETNAGASVTYTDHEGNIQTKAFPEPTVKPLIIEMAKVLKDADGNIIPDSFSNDRLFNFNVTLDDDANYNKNYLTGGNMAKVMTDIRIDGRYTLAEDSITGNPLTNLSDYQTTINWTTYDGTQSGTLVNGTSYSGFGVPRARDANNEPLNTKFTIENTELPLGKITIYKFVNNTPAANNRRTRAAEAQFSVEVVGTNIYNPSEEIYRQTHTLTASTPIVLDGLQYGEYSVIETVTNGFTPTYTDSEGTTTDGKVKVTIDGKDQSVTVKNTPSADTAYVDFTATKKWVGGNDADHIAVELTLYQDGIAFTDITPTVNPATGTAAEFVYTWTGLPRYNKSGGEAVYTVKEKNQTPLYIVTQEGNVITNTFDDTYAPFTVNADKRWVGGGTDKPDIWFTLYRKVGTDGTEELVTVDDDGTAITSTKQVVNNAVSWDNMPRIEGTDITKVYTYFVKETNATGEDFTPINYSKVENLLTVTNTYASPLTEDLIGTKTWVNGPVTKPTVSLELWRRGGTAGAGERVVEATVATRDTVNFGKHDATDINGVAYVYYVEEVGEVDNKITLGGFNYQVVYDGLNVKNTFMQAYSTVNANKVWEGGPVTKPDIGFKLYRNIENGDVEAVSGATIYRLESGITEAYWANQPTTDEYGNTYTYSVTEVDRQGEVLDLADYDTTIDELTVTNRYVSPTADVTATKTWIDGGETKPTIWFSLYRKISGGTGEPVMSIPTETEPAAPLRAELPHGTASHTWPGLPINDDNGNAYEYYVLETDANGDTSWQPQNYRKNEIGLTVTNYYVSPLIDEFTVTKIWEGDDRVTRPTMVVTLWRQYEDDTGTVQEVVPNVETKEVNGTTTTATWTGLPETTLQGHPLTYFVKETFKEDKASNANWVLGEYNFEDNTITNRVVNNNDEDNPEKTGKLDIEKVLMNEPEVAAMKVRAASEPLKFIVVVTDEYGVGTPVEIKAGETKNLTNLYFGEYTVEEIEANGYTPSYNQTTATVYKEATEVPKFIVTNKNDGGTEDDPTTVDITLEKVWVNGPKPGATIELWKSGFEVDGVTTIDERVGDLAATDTVLTKEFKGLAKHDPSGREYTYYAKEPTPPDNYTVSIEGTKVTNTYTVPSEGEYTFTKIWEGDDRVTRPTMVVTLWRQYEDGTGTVQEVVPNVETKEVNGTTTTATWTGLPETTLQGHPLTYFVKETFKEDKASNANWVLGEYNFEDNTITNRVVNNNDEDNPEKIGEIIIRKELVNEDNPDLLFKVKVTGPYGVVKNGDLDYFEIADEQELVIDELYYGNYTVEEIEVPSKYTVTIDNPSFVLDKILGDEGEVISPVENVKIVNTMSDSMSVTGRKVWVGSNGTTIEVQLYQNGRKYGTPVIFREGKTSHTWTNLPKADDAGKEYRYTIDEESVPVGYIKEISNNGLTITNTWVLNDIIWGGGGYPALIKDDHFAYVEGYPDGGFRPDAEITRAEVAAIFARLMVEQMDVRETYVSNYSDVHMGAWYYNYIGYLTRYNILNGYPDGSFRPDNSITRAEFSKVASMFDRISGGESNFFDVPVDHWAKRFIDSAYNKGWVKGYPDGSFRPERFLSRAETVTVINRMLERYADEDFVLRNQLFVKNYNDGTRNHWAYFEIMEASNSHDYERILNNRERWLRLRPIE